MSKNRRLKMPTPLETTKKMKTKVVSRGVCVVKKLRGNDLYPGGFIILKGRRESSGKRRESNKSFDEVRRNHRLIIEPFYKCN